MPGPTPGLYVYNSRQPLTSLLLSKQPRFKPPLCCIWLLVVFVFADSVSISFDKCSCLALHSTITRYRHHRHNGCLPSLPAFPTYLPTYPCLASQRTCMQSETVDWPGAALLATALPPRPNHPRSPPTLAHLALDHKTNVI